MRERPWPRRRPYARQYDDADRWPATAGGWLAWAVFRMPGAVLLWCDYFFPRRGNVWASARRPGNRIMEVLFTPALYAAIAVVVAGWATHR